MSIGWVAFLMSNIHIPSHNDLMNPVLQALKALGGSATIEELNNLTAQIANLSDEQLEVPHNPETGGQSEAEYRMAWARTYLKKFGLLENSKRGVWALTSNGNRIENINPQEVTRFVRSQTQKLSSKNEVRDATDTNELWREQLLNILLNMHPSAFERLVQRILRESGFIQVEVTGQSGDGGVDGKGIMQLAGFLSFHVIFQCKRYKNTVSASQIRDFRGAMVGRADKGLMITTGNFTRGAIQEATRDGAPAIDLIDGDLLLDKLKDLGLGVETKIIEIEEVHLNEDWFLGI